jgi:hypothetical protein
MLGFSTVTVVGALTAVLPVSRVAATTISVA